MTIIEIQALSNGAHRNQTVSGDITPPEGWAAIPAGMAIPSTFPFVEVEARNGVVISLTPGVVPEPEPEPTPEPTEEEDIAAMTVDHEYRLTLLELGLTEEV